MGTEILIIAGWLGLALVNIMVGKEKGIGVALLIVPSIIAAPLVYLYVLAIPPTKLGQKN